MHHKTIAELHKALQSKNISSAELTLHFLNRIKKFDKTLNSFITVTEETALQEAEAADRLFSSGEAGPLTGIPFAHKDIFCTKGIKTSAGSRMLDNFIAPYDATIVKNLKSAGIVLLGKTNMDEFAMGSSNENSFYGPVKNPWDLSVTPGGSSGGSSAAVAARLTPASTGTDTGGSIRQPAALTGITGLKPTYGRVSRYGMIAFASSLDQAGPMTQTAEDAAILLNVMAGYDEKDSTSINKPVPDYTANLNHSIQGLKIGLPKEYFTSDLDSDIEKIIENAVREYKKLGAKIIDISLPHTEYAASSYYVLAPAECSSNLARYDGVRFGHRAENPKNLEDLYVRSRSEGFGSEVQRRIIVGTYVLSSGYYDAFYLKAQKMRRLILNDFMEAFKKVDVILTPSTPSVAFKLGEKLADPVAMYLSDIFNIAVNLAGIPALSIPIGFSQQLPVGLQLMGKHFDEATILNAAHQYQLISDWHKRTPSDY